MPKWYGEGLRFACTQCGNCCTGSPGTVNVTLDESKALADLLHLPLEEFQGLHTWKPNPRLRSLREKKNGDCVFFERGKGCTVYPVRPRQCKTWPFWRSIVKTEDAWLETAKDCPGMGKGNKMSAEFIAATAENDGTT